VVAVVGLNEPAASGSDFISKPSNTALHQAYSFYVKVTATGNANAYFGPYQVKVGCFADSLTFIDSLTFVTLVNKNVADATAGVYTMNNPTPSLAYCVFIDNVVVNNDATGTSWTGTVKLTGSATSMSLVTSANAETINFKIKSRYTNN